MTLGFDKFPNIITQPSSAAKLTPTSAHRDTESEGKMAPVPPSAPITSSGMATGQRGPQTSLNPKALNGVTLFQSKPKPHNGVHRILSFKKHSLPTSVPPVQTDTNRVEHTLASVLRTTMLNEPTLASLNIPSASTHSWGMSSCSSGLGIATPNTAFNVVAAHQQNLQISHLSTQVDAMSVFYVRVPIIWS